MRKQCEKTDNTCYNLTEIFITQCQRDKTVKCTRASRCEQITLSSWRSIKLRVCWTASLHAAGHVHCVGEQPLFSGAALSENIYHQLILLPKSRNSSVGIALCCGLHDRGSKVRFPARAGNLSLHHWVQNGSGAHPASYPVCTRALSLGVKWTGCEAGHSPPSNSEIKERLELYFHSLNTPSWRGGQLKHRGIFTF
jgi:hypothetical protein